MSIDPGTPIEIEQVSPIGAALAGGIEITISGSGFQPGAAVYFGTVASTEVTFEDEKHLRAQLPPASESGSVAVGVVNPDRSVATLEGGFTYVPAESGEYAEILSIEPASILEDTDTEITVRGRNLIFAFEKGSFLLRGPTRANVQILSTDSRHDEPTGIEEIILTLRIAATPALLPNERMFIQVLASQRSEAQSDGIFESSRRMLVVLPNAVPVPLAYTANINPDKATLIVIAGRNLEGCSFDLGDRLFHNHHNRRH